MADNATPTLRVEDFNRSGQVCRTASGSLIGFMPLRSSLVPESLQSTRTISVRVYYVRQRSVRRYASEMPSYASIW
jgi:hypothetical protein